MRASIARRRPPFEQLPRNQALHHFGDCVAIDEKMLGEHVLAEAGALIDGNQRCLLPRRDLLIGKLARKSFLGRKMRPAQQVRHDLLQPKAIENGPHLGSEPGGGIA